ncbi:MAG: YmdB family metallophosphoesterase [Vampirovibrionales bacterium]
MNILFFGDIVGKPGREAVKYYLEQLNTQPYDVVIANSENATHGFGFSEKNYHELMAAGIHGFTGGNHSFDRAKDAHIYDTFPNLIRPLNIGHKRGGRGFCLIDTGKTPLALVNILGQTFMQPYDSPWKALEETLPHVKALTPFVLLDVHAEATAEKFCLATYAGSLGASVVLGTHTHVQTADERLLSNGTTGFLTDVGFNGAQHSSIGMNADLSLAKFLGEGQGKNTVAESHEVQVCAVAIQLDEQTGHCLGLTRIFERFTLPPHIKVAS